MKKFKSTPKNPETQENNGQKKPYPLLPYLIGLFVMVVVLVVLSYLMQLRNKQELTPTSASYTVTETAFQL